MVMIALPKQELMQAVGTQLSEQELQQALFDLGMELDAWDEELSIEITPERLDLASVQGLARALKYYLGMEQEYPRFPVHQSRYEVQVHPEMQHVRKHTVCAVITGLQLTEDKLQTIIDLQEKLHATLGRQRKRGAIGVYPMEHITWPIHFKAAKPEAIRFQPLESSGEMTAKELLTEHPTGKTYAHLLEVKELFPYFIDAANNILSVPPIINSATTGRVTSATQNVFLECSGDELPVLDQLLTIMTTSLADMGGTLHEVHVRYGEQEHCTPRFSDIITRFRPAQVHNKIGISLSEQEIEQCLRKMMHEVHEKQDDVWIVKSPHFRADIWHEIDLVDDVARAFGYNAIELTHPQIDGIGATLPLSDLREELSEVMVGLGFLESYTFALTSKEEQLGNMLLDENRVRYVPVANGNENQSMLRISLLPQQLQLLAHNRNRPLPQKLFEGSFVVLPDASKDVQARNEMHFCGLITDKVVTFTEIRQALDALLRSRGIEVTVKTGSHPSFLPGRVGTVYVGETPIGIVGEVHPQVLSNFGLQNPVGAFEINLEKLL